jgi:hypothetical protein
MILALSCGDLADLSTMQSRRFAGRKQLPAAWDMSECGVEVLNEPPARCLHTRVRQRRGSQGVFGRLLRGVEGLRPNYAVRH